ncbi:hypothetical protein [Sneathiella sp.]|mgnify:CR=1 FL=1|uniref:hypothetical protein n=1 Tax=Sneathiella sp. TaxID=1964365 RepID=UPI002FE387D5
MILIRYLAPGALGSLLVKTAEEQTAARSSQLATTRGGDAEILYLWNEQKEGRSR